MDEDEKKSKEAVETAEVENDESDRELDPAGLQKAFRFAAWSSVALVGPFPILTRSFQRIDMDVNSDAGHDHPHSTSTVLRFDCLRRWRAFRQVERLFRFRNVAFKLTCTCLLFVAWVVVGMIWTFCSSFIVVLYPLWESRRALTQIARGVVKVRCFPSAASMIPPLKPRFFLLCVGHLFSWKRKVHGARRVVQVVKRSRKCRCLLSECSFIWFGCCWTQDHDRSI